MRKNIRNLLTCVIGIILIGSCVEVDNNFSKLPPGMWRATLQLEGEILSNPIERNSEINIAAFNSSSGELPFNFEVFYENDSSFYIEIINGSERIRVDDIKYGRDKQTAKDTVRINFKEYDSYIEAIFVENKMEGNWIVNYRESYKIPFVAIYGQKHRFSSLDEKPNHKLSGNWQAEFDINEDKPYPAKAIFDQKDEIVTGTFLTETGDYRFLEGIVYGDKLKLSCFDGSHAFLFEGKLLQDSSIYGIFRSGTHYLTEWIAFRNEDFELSDPYKLTYLTENSTIDIEGLLKGANIDPNDEKLIEFNNSSVKLIQLMGTWCPNCKDEVVFLKSYLSEHPDYKLGVLGLCFERYRDKETSQIKIENYRKNMEVPYPLYLGGYYDKKEASKMFPMFNKISAYPTLLFVNKQNEIVDVHTGFSGPATSEYQKFIEEFDQNIKKLLNE